MRMTDSGVCLEDETAANGLEEATQDNGTLDMEQPAESRPGSHNITQFRQQ
jgi:hypothetical protein